MIKIIKNRQGRKQVSGFYFLGIDFYRLFLNLLLLSTFGFLAWFGIKLFGEHAFDAVIGSVVFILSFVFFIWLWRHTKRNRWRSPGMKLTVVCLIALFVVTAFAGVQPMAGYKNETFSRITTAWDNWQSEQEQRRIVEENRKAAEEVEAEQKEEKRAEFDKAINDLTSPELVAEYMKNNVSYDYEKYQEWLTGDFYWGFDTPEEVFNGKKTNCGGYAIFALYSLLNAGYNYDNFEKNRTNAAVILGSMGLDYHDVHTVLLYVEDSLFYIIDLDEIKGPFETIEDAATASLSTWITYYFYDIDTEVTKTVGKKISEEERSLLLGKQVVRLVNIIRKERGSSELVWDDKLYEYSLAHTKDMAAQRRLFHTNMNKSYAGVIWIVRAPKPSELDLEPPEITASDLELETPPRCPKCETEIEQSRSFWGGYVWKCVKCGFHKRNSDSYYREEERARKIAKRHWEVYKAQTKH